VGIGRGIGGSKVPRRRLLAVDERRKRNEGKQNNGKEQRVLSLQPSQRLGGSSERSGEIFKTANKKED